MGWGAWTALALALIGAAAFGLWRYAHATGAVNLLEWADRTIGGTDGTRLAANGVRYGSLPAQRLVIVTPDRPGPHPVVVFYHGGGWQTGRPEDYRFIGRTLARAGYVVALPAYRLGPEGVYPHMLEDGAQALAWVAANIERYGGDPQRLVLMGHSAGAHTAVMLGLERQWLGREGLDEGLVKGVIGLSGPYDFYPYTSDWARDAFGHVADPAVTQPIRFVRGDAPPMLLLTGSEDTTVKPRNTAVLGKALSAAGASVDVVTILGMDHVGPVMTMARPFDRDGRVKQAVLAFLAQRVPASAPVQAATE